MFHDAVYIACSVQNANDFDGLCRHPIEKNVLLDHDAAQAGMQLFPGSTHFG